MQTLFNNFPIINYNGQNVVDITKNITIDPSWQSNPLSFDSVTLNDLSRSDSVAYNTYFDPYMEWLIFMANQKVDPYDWYLDYDAFYSFLDLKYGDYLLAENKIIYYLNNWYENSNNPISEATYQTLDPSLTKYFVPSYDAAGNIVEYFRRQIDWIYNTNQVVKLYFTFNLPNTFIKDEIINIQYDVNIYGNGQISYVDNNSLYFQHITGNSLPIDGNINASAFILYSQQSNNTITITNSNQIYVDCVNVIPVLEQVYYEPYTYFDYENEKNESNKNIILLNPLYGTQIAKELTKVFQ